MGIQHCINTVAGVFCCVNIKFIQLPFYTLQLYIVRHHTCMYKIQNKRTITFLLHFFICQLIVTCFACLCPFISFFIINLTFSKFMHMPTGIFLPSTCSDSTAKLCYIEEKIIHQLVNVEDAILSMHALSL